MATITVRISDSTRDALLARAAEEHQSLSDFVRDRLEDAVFRHRDDDEEEGGGLAPSSMSVTERHTLALLHRILGRVLPDDAGDDDGDLEYQLKRAAVLEQGFTKEYWTEFLQVRPELSAQQCSFVMDVLDLFRFAKQSIKALRSEGTTVEEGLERALTFKGFDHNNPVEHHMSTYVTHLVKQGKWVEQESFVLGEERGNSHQRMTEIYSRMLTAYREVKQQQGPSFYDRESFVLNEDELRQIAAARIHPSNR